MMRKFSESERSSLVTLILKEIDDPTPVEDRRVLYRLLDKLDPDEALKPTKTKRKAGKRLVDLLENSDSDPAA